MRRQALKERYARVAGMVRAWFARRPWREGRRRKGVLHGTGVMAD